MAMEQKTDDIVTGAISAKLDNDDFPAFPEDEEPLEIVRVESTAPSAEEGHGLFARHEGVPAHVQAFLDQARIVFVGGGGLNGATVVALVRSGARSVTIIDDDRVELTNLSRQFFTVEDLGSPKGKRLARNVASHAIAGAEITGIGLPFEEAMATYPLPADLFIAGVDNNECRLQVVREARRREVPAIFTMLSRDGMRCQCFKQDASPLGPCLWCALPNLDPEHHMPCSSAIISSCFMAAGFTTFFAHRALMGWGDLQPFNWREADLSGRAPDRIGRITKRPGCPVCSVVG